MRLFNLKLPHSCLSASADRQDVFLHILADNVERQAGCLKKPKTVPLALGEEPNAVVFTDDLTLGIHHRTGFCRKPFPQKFCDRNRSNEADSLAIGAGFVREIKLLGNFSHFLLGVAADWKHNLFKLFLGQLVEEITLVLALVHSAQQVEVILILLDAGVMAGGDIVNLKVSQGFFNKNPELDLAVADDVRVGGPTGFVLVKKISYNLRAVLPM